MRIMDSWPFEGVQIGHGTDAAGGTGCTVIISEKGMAAGMDIRGGGPASRESGLLDPLAAAQRIHAVVLSGGSAFGLACADGVMRWLKERGVGFDTGIARVPLVCQSCLFDLGVGDSAAFPDGALGYRACEAAAPAIPEQGNVGAGTGATVGKFKGAETMMKSGLGFYGIQTADFAIAAVVAVNALGDIYDTDTGRELAGMLTADHRHFEDTLQAMTANSAPRESLFAQNTTIGAVITDAGFDKTALTKIAGMAQDGLARAIRPVHTMADGDTVYALSAGNAEADINTAGALAAEVTARAIAQAVLAARPAYHLMAACDL